MPLELRDVVRGGEAELRGQWGAHFTAFVNYARLEVKPEAALLNPDGAPLEAIYAPEHKVNLGVYYGVEGSIERARGVGREIFGEVTFVF